MKKLNLLGCSSVRKHIFWPSHFFGGDSILPYVVEDRLYILYSTGTVVKTLQFFIQLLKNFANGKAMTANFLIAHHLFPQLIVPVCLTGATSALNSAEMRIL